MDDKGLTCTNAGYRRPDWDWHMPWGHDWESHSDEEIIGECCPLTCHAHNVIAGRNIPCPTGSLLREEHDFHVPFGSDHTPSDEEILAECCRRNCDSVMTHHCANGETGGRCHCINGGVRRPDWDWHDPFGGDWDSQSAEDIVRECCPITCHAFHAIHSHTGSMNCEAGQVLRGEDDFHEPSFARVEAPTAEEFRAECCQPEPRNCEMVMVEREMDCHHGSVMRPGHDWHMPWGSDWDSRSDDEIRGECCQRNCHSVTEERGMHDGYCIHDGPCCHSPRGHEDWHMPWWGDGWDDRSDEEIIGECCHGGGGEHHETHRVGGHNCWSFMEELMMYHCENGGERRGHDDWHMPWWGDPGHPDWTGDDWYSRSREEIEEECCVGGEGHDDGEDMSAEETLALGAVALLAGKDLLSWLAGGLEHGL